MTYPPPVGVWRSTPVRRAVWAINQAWLRVRRDIPEQGHVDAWTDRLTDLLDEPVRAFDWEAWAAANVTKAENPEPPPGITFDDAADEIIDDLWTEAGVVRAGLEGLPFDEADLADALDTTMSQVRGIDESSREALRRTMREVLDEGTGQFEFAKRIRETWAGVARQRATMIAVTEWNRAASQATIIGYRRTGVERKRWFTAGDQRVCGQCEANAAEGEVPIDQAFPAGADAPPQHPGCRCNIAAA